MLLNPRLLCSKWPEMHHRFHLCLPAMRTSRATTRVTTGRHTTRCLPEAPVLRRVRLALHHLLVDILQTKASHDPGLQFRRDPILTNYHHTRHQFAQV